jgi:hypothetical protein
MQMQSVSAATHVWWPLGLMVPSLALLQPLLLLLLLLVEEGEYEA